MRISTHTAAPYGPLDLLLYSVRCSTPYLLIPVFTNHQLRQRGIDSADHRHAVYHIIFITSGEGTFQSGSIRDIRKGDIIVVDPNEPHIFAARTAALRYFSFTFHFLSLSRFMRDHRGNVLSIPKQRRLLERYAEKRPLEKLFGVPAPHIRPSPAEQSRMTHAVDRFIETAEPLIREIDVLDYIGEYYTAEGYRRYLRAAVRFFSEFLDALTPVKSPSPQNDALVKRITDEIDSRVYEKYSLASLAGTLGYTPQHLAQVFRRHTGMSPGDYASAGKIRKACELLRETRLSTAEIANRLGYGSSQHFSTAFRRTKHMTPREYRGFSM